MARVIVADEFGPPESYRIEEREVGAPGPGEITVAVRAIGVSYVDVLTAMGKYQVTPSLPFVPGSECAGVVTAVGEGVTHVALGDAVMGSSFGNIFVSEGTFRAASFSKVPDALSLEQAAVFPPSYLTAAHALIDRGRLQAGETLLVLGAAGATGIAAIQTGKALGARVIASASSQAKRDLCLRAGADAAIDTRSATWRDDVKAALVEIGVPVSAGGFGGGRGVDVVFDPVGGDMTDPAFRSLGYDGRYLVIGFTGGMASLKTNLPLVKTASLIGVQIRVFGVEEPERMAHTQARVHAFAAQGLLQPAIGRAYPFAQYAAAMDDAFAGRTAGRIVLTVE